MRYTEENVRKALKKVDPGVYEVYANLAKLELPDVINRVFISGFYETLRSYLNTSASAFFWCHSITPQDVDVLLRAYGDLHDRPGYFQFEEE